MGQLPGIDGYPFPQPSELDSTGPDWTLSSDRAVLLVHDMQRYFLRPFEKETRKILVGNVSRLVGWARRHEVQVAWSQQPGSMTPEERGLLADIWGPGMTTSVTDRALVDPLVAQDQDWALTKWRYSAFVRSDLANLMNSRGLDQLIVCGVYGHVGIVATAADAYQRDVEVFLPADAIGDLGPTQHLATVTWASRTCAKILNTAQITP